VSTERAAALEYAAGGHPVFPAKRDKRPLTEHGFKDATTDLETVERWWARWPTAGIATPTGLGFFVLDVDKPQALAELEVAHEQLPPTVEALTPRPGRHVYLAADDVSNSRGELPAGLDVRGRGGYVLLPPSPHPNGVYEWRTAFDEAPIARAPAWLLGLLETAQSTAPPVDGDIPAQQRNSSLASMAGTMRRRGFSEAAIASALLTENRTRCKPPLSDREVRGIAQSVARYKPEDEAVASLEELTGILGLDQAGKRVDRVRVYGRGGRAHVCIYLDDGERIVLDPLGACSSAPKLTVELASQAGATPTLKAPDVATAFKLFYLLGEHQDAGEIAPRAWELGAEYLRAAVCADVAMGEQASRWRAFLALESAKRHDIVLRDLETGVRYVRAQWVMEHLRDRTNPGEPAAMMAELERLGWAKCGKEGRIKATQPEFGRALQWAFYSVEDGWEQE
jgi:Bifunctional DNA primase/polymerase, N-terminal/Primase C terminal 1 (PriCT-1)